MFGIFKGEKMNKNILKGIKCSRKVYNTYGKILKINMFHICFFVDIFIPTFRLLTYLGYKLKHIEIIRLTIKKD